MRLLLWKYTCDRCGAVTIAPVSMPHQTKRLLRSEGSDDIVWCDVVEDPTFKEVSNILHKNSLFASQGTGYQLKLLDILYARIACEPDSQGYSYRLYKHPSCTHCRLREMKQFMDINPPEYVDLDLAEVTHVLWDSLTREDKVKRVDAILKQYLGKAKT